MKNIPTTILSLLLLTMFTQCASSQFDKNPPFTIKTVTYKDWKTDHAIVTIELSSTLSNEIVFDSIYFRNKISKLILSANNNKTLLIGNFTPNLLKDRNIILHADPRKEMANKVPKSTKKFIFNIADNEAVISFSYKGKTQYYKIENVQKETLNQ